MWCAICHQDVPLRPGVAAAAVCSRCAEKPENLDEHAPDACASYLNEDTLKDDAATVKISTQATDFDNSALEHLLAGPPLPEEDWQFEAELRDVNRLVDRLRRTTPQPAPRGEQPATIPFQPFPTAAVPSAMLRLQSASLPAAPAKPAERSGFAAWLLLSLGLATLACGGVLLGWSLAADRSDLWSIGLPLTLIGQAGLILGLILQFEGLWRSNRHTDETLSQLDGQLSELRHATTMLSTTHSTPAQSFYVHMAEGASPQLLMADLKGQLDLLAQQMAARERRSA